MAFKSNINPQDRGVYFALSGDNALDGLSLERPKLDIQPAINAAFGLVPTPSIFNTAQVIAAQGGVFNESIVLQDAILFDGTLVSLRATSAIGVDLASFLDCSVFTITNNQTNGICFNIDGKESVGVDCKFVGVLGSGASIGVNVTDTVDNIFLNLSQIALSTPGATGIDITATMTTPIDMNINAVSLDANNTIYCNCDASSTTDICVMDISSIKKKSGTTGTKGIVCKNGTLTVIAGNIDAHTAIDLQSTGKMNLACTRIEGDIIVAAGTILECVIMEHVSGSITNNGTINGVINGVYFGTWRQKHEEQVVLNAFSASSQIPAGTDILTQIEFGAAQFGASDPVELSVLGAVTVNQSDQYNISLVLQYGRTGASGSSAMVFFRILVDGVQFGGSRFGQLDNPNQAFPIQFSIPVDLVAAQILTFEFWRDSGGFDAGELIPQTPALGGTSPAASAQLILTRNRLIQPVD